MLPNHEPVSTQYAVDPCQPSPHESYMVSVRQVSAVSGLGQMVAGVGKGVHEQPAHSHPYVFSICSHEYEPVPTQ